MEYLDKMTTSLDSNIGAYTDFDVIEMEIEMLKSLAELEAYDVGVPDTEVTSVPGEINRGVIAEMIGRIGEITANVDASVTVEDVKTFKEFDKIITTIAPISSDRAWIHEHKNNAIKQLSLQGKETNSVTLPPHNDFITLSNGDFVVTDVMNRAIRRVTSGGKVSDIVSTKPLHPTLISKTQTDDLLVTLRDDGDLYKLQPTSRRLVQRLTLTGKVLHTYEFREDGKTRLFTAPYRTTENSNSDICAMNRTGEYTGELIVLHGDGRVQATYRGQKDSTFDLRDVACDSQNRIIVLDSNGKRIHQLSPHGTFLRYLLPDMFDFPHSMALYHDILWVGFLKGTVKVYKYKYNQ